LAADQARVPAGLAGAVQILQGGQDRVGGIDIDRHQRPPSKASEPAFIDALVRIAGIRLLDEG
jgi:hypothetical protein